MIELRAYAGLLRNHKELASQLGVSIEGMSRKDREEALVVAAYKKWGCNMGKYLNGQFAIALFDTDANTLFCTRDILGAELFFYYETEDKQLLYGTEIKELFDQPGFKRELNEEMIQVYLGFTYLPGEETLFKGVYKLAPGGYLIHNGETLHLGQYWELTFEPDESKSLEEWADDLTAAMEASLECIMDEDEVCDSFLSGGVDSSYILAKSKARKGFCAAYENQDASEEEEARATAQYLERDFEGLRVTPEEFLGNVDEFLLAYELPTADVAGLSLYCAAKQMKEGNKSTLCFSGEGADEFFAGYSVYAPKTGLRKMMEGTYFGTTYIMNPSEQRRFLKHYYPNHSTESFIEERAAKGKGYDELGRKLYTDMRTYFEGSILYNSTKISRGTGLDIRMPYCDLRIFEIARHMPSCYKATGISVEENKIALRAAASRVLPPEVAYRKKLGFPVPVRAWLAEPAFANEIRRAFESDAAKLFFKVDELTNLLDVFLGGKAQKHALWYSRRKGIIWRHVWTIYTFIRWYELFFNV